MHAGSAPHIDGGVCGLKDLRDTYRRVNIGRNEIFSVFPLDCSREIGAKNRSCQTTSRGRPEWPLFTLEGSSRFSCIIFVERNRRLVDWPCRRPRWHTNKGSHPLW